LRRTGVVFSALGLREGWLYAQLSESERYLDPLIEGARLIGLPQSRVPDFAPALVVWTAGLFPGETPAETRLRVAICALSDLAWRDHPDLRAQESFRRVLQLPFIGIEHAERVFLAAALHARYNGRPDDPYLMPAAGLLSRSQRRRAQVVGRTIALAYRLSAGAPAVLKDSALKIGADGVILEVGNAARVPDSEVVMEHLQQLAGAVGVKRCEVVGVGASS
jgi:exopolyphosphatase/guanosine-5'-triphosphate,3'-diphosphate pyrophosphatase